MVTKIQLLILLLSLWSLVGCDNGGGSSFTSSNLSQEEVVLRKFVVVGDSITSGFQSNGLSEEFQENSYPNLMARQMGLEDVFEQPIISSPGIGGTPGKEPFTFVGGQILEEDLTVNPLSLLENSTLLRSYDNLGIPGARLSDTQDTLFSVTNPFFDIILRNPALGNRDQLEQALDLNPSLMVVWIGNNDILSSATQGGNLSIITSQAEFEEDYTDLVSTIRSRTSAAVVLVTIANVADIPFVNSLDGIFRTDTILGPTSVPVVFDENFNPVDFGGGLYVPLVTAETGVDHVLVSGLAAYLSGVGIPDQAALEGFGFDSVTAAALVAGMTGAGLTPTGIPLPGTTTLTASEESAILNEANGFNNTIQSLANQFDMVVADVRPLLSTINNFGIEGFTGNFVLQDPINTAFSLDGVHPNNAGAAIIANFLIETINSAFFVNIPLLDLEPFRGQYAAGAGF